MKAPTFENAIAFARDLIRLPSLPGEEEAVARRVVEEMQALGYDSAEIDRFGNVIGRIHPTGGVSEAERRAVMLSCHLDMVAIGDPEEWEFPPLAGEVDGGFLHGRGAMDIKGPLALQTYAAVAAARSSDGVNGDLIVAHTVFEERGGLGMKRMLEEGGVRPDVVIIGESTHGDICIGHRGRAELEVVISGLAGHASAPDRARNALDLLPDVLRALDVVSGTQPSNDTLGAATLAPTMVNVLPESRNVIPDQVTIALDWRVLPTQELGGLLDTVNQVLVAHVDVPEGFDVSVRVATEGQTTWTGVAEIRDLHTPGFLMDVEAPIVRAAAHAVGRREGSGAAVIRPWTFATDGGWSHGVHQIPTIGFAPGEERYAHTNTERLDLSEAEWAYSVYPSLIKAVLQASA